MLQGTRGKVKRRTSVVCLFTPRTYAPTYEVRQPVVPPSSKVSIRRGQEGQLDWDFSAGKPLET